MKVLKFKYKLIIPVVVVLSLIIVFPLLYAFYVSFHKYLLITGLGKFIWFGNYIKGTDQEFLNASYNTLILTASVVTLEFMIAFGLGLPLNRKDLKFKNLYFIILTIPITIPPIGVGLIWRLILHPTLGVANHLLQLFRMPPQAWFGNPKAALLTIIGVDIWHETSLMIMILLAGLTSLPESPFEAATIDGAGPFQKFWYITVPLMKPVITVALIIRMIAALKTYDLIYICTKGGPGTKTQTLSYLVYRKGFRFLDMGIAASLSYLLLGMILVATLVIIKTIGKRE